MKNYLATLQKYGLTSVIKDEGAPAVITSDEDFDREFELFAKSLNINIEEGDNENV